MNDPEVAVEELATFAEHLHLIYDLADGQRAELVRRGWDEGIAEATAANILNALIMTIFKQQGVHTCKEHP